jgi:hypothetical protein
MACARSDDRANSRQPSASPLGAKPVRDLPEHWAPTHGWLACVMRGWKGGVIQTPEPGVAERGLAFLQPSPMGGGGLAREPPVDTPLELTTLLRQRGGSQGVAAVVKGTRAPPSRLHARGTHGVPGLEGQWATPQLMGPPDRPVLGRVVPLGTVASGDPAGRAMGAPDVAEHPMATAGVNARHPARGIWQAPRPCGTAVDSGPGCLTTAQPAAAQARQALLHPVGQAGVHPPAAVGPGSFAAGDPRPLCEERGQPRVTDGGRGAQGGRQTLDGGATGWTGVHAPRNRGHIRRSPVGTLPGLRLHAGDHGLAR